MMKILVSRCLLGENCKYNGGNNRNEEVLSILDDPNLEIIPVCPEQLGGLQTPRDPSEIRGNRVFAKNGRDVTMSFLTGASLALYDAMAKGVDAALLKNGSPSCGTTRIYDGTFTGTKIPGQGMTARLLAANHIPLFSEENLGDFADWLKQNQK